MKTIIPAFIFLVLASFFAACKKDQSFKEEAARPGVSQAVMPQIKLCEMRSDAAKSALAKRRGATSSNTPVVLLLDFNGHTVSNTLWNNEGPFYCPAVPSTILTAEQKNNIVKGVAEDFIGYKIIITRDEQEYRKAPADRRMRCVITYNMGARFPVGGIAYIGSMAWADDTPCFVFCDNLFYFDKYIFNAISHELGHTLGLDHQSFYNSSCGLEQIYHPGFGTGEALSWAPIMGLMYYTDISTWHSGPTPTGCNFIQNDMNMLSSVAGIKHDDFIPDLNDHTAILPATGAKKGILETAADKDAFWKKDNDKKRIRVISNGNSDIALEVYNANRQLISVYDNPSGINAEAVISGKKYIKVRLSSNQPYVPAGEGYGGYSINVSKP